MYTATMTIGGHTVQSAATFEVKNPSTGQTVGTAPNATHAEVLLYFEAASFKKMAM